MELDPRDDELDRLDKSGHPDELMAHWAAQEAKVAGFVASASQLRAELAPVSRRYARHGQLLAEVLTRFLRVGRAEASLRRNALKLLWRLLAPSYEAWFQTVTLLDARAGLSYKGLSAELLPCYCLALARLVAKFNGDAVQIGQLRTLGTREVAAEAVARQEARLLVQDGQLLCLPPLVQWLSALHVRLRAVAEGMPRLAHAAALLGKAWDCAAQAAWVLLWAGELPRALPPSHAAVGLLGCALVQTALLPLDALRPPGLSFLQWSVAFCRGQRQPRAELPESSLEAQDWLALLAGLEVATRCCGADLRFHAHSVLVALAGAQARFSEEKAT